MIHTRDAEDDTRRVFEELLPTEWRVHVHCFTGTLEFAQWAIARFPNLYIGFTGCITFPSASDLRAIVCAIPLDRLLLVRTRVRAYL